MSARLLGLLSLIKHIILNIMNWVIHQKCLIRWTGEVYEIPGFLGSNTGDNYDILENV